MSENNIEVENTENVIKALNDAFSSDRIIKNLQKACALVERAAKQNAPKGTGELRRSIASRVEDNGGELLGIVYTPLEYAPYVEYGTGLFAEGGNGRQDVPWVYFDDEKQEFVETSGMKPQPYLRPALDENREAIKRILKEGITE